MPKPSHDVMSVLSQWEPDRDKGVVGNVASLLDFAARKIPGSPISWSVVTKCILGGKMPHPDSKTVQDMRRRSSAARVVLGRDYKRGLENVHGLGVRATTDSDDYANTQLRRDANKLEGARTRFVTSHARVDPKTMKNKELRIWVEESIPKVLVSSYNDRMAKFLLPPGEDNKDAKDKK